MKHMSDKFFQFDREAGSADKCHYGKMMRGSRLWQLKRKINEWAGFTGRIWTIMKSYCRNRHCRKRCLSEISPSMFMFRSSSWFAGMSMDKVAQILKETASSRPSKSIRILQWGSSELVGIVQLFIAQYLFCKILYQRYKTKFCFLCCEVQILCHQWCHRFCWLNP